MGSDSREKGLQFADDVNTVRSQEVGATSFGEDGRVVMTGIGVSGMVSNTSIAWFDAIPVPPFQPLL